MENKMGKDNKTDSKKNPKANADHPDDGKENKTKNKGSFIRGGFKKASEVRHQPGLQVNIPIGSKRLWEQETNTRSIDKKTSEMADKNETPDADSLEKKTNKGSYTHRGFKKASEVKHQPGLQVNIPIGSNKPSEQISNIPRNSKMTSEEVDENKTPNTDSPDK